jgi:hypothetical protein
MKTPVVFLIFNRTDTTEKVFETIRQVKPPKLLVVADGPRQDKVGEAEKCTAARAIIDRVDWECEVLTNYSEVNLGCKIRVSTGINWVFEQVEEAIILEDDCLPHPSFFRFCEELLEYYRHDTRIMAICGNNYIFGGSHTTDSYYFSRDFHCWGWACWKRAWQHYDHEMKLWLQIRDKGWLKDIFQDKNTVTYWEYILQSVYNNQIDSWAYRWMFTCWIQNGLSILPNVNLISNIGYGKDATHTIKQSPLSNMPVSAMNFPIQHPLFMIRDTKVDRFTLSYRFGMNIITLWRIKVNYFKKLLKIITDLSSYYRH